MDGVIVLIAFAIREFLDTGTPATPSTPALSTPRPSV